MKSIIAILVLGGALASAVAGCALAPAGTDDSRVAAVGRITDTTTGRPPKPIARRVAISTCRLATAVYMQLRAPNVAPTAMNTATV